MNQLKTAVEIEFAAKKRKLVEQLLFVLNGWKMSVEDLGQKYSKFYSGDISLTFVDAWNRLFGKKCNCSSVCHCNTVLRFLELHSSSFNLEYQDKKVLVSAAKGNSGRVRSTSPILQSR